MTLIAVYPSTSKHRKAGDRLASVQCDGCGKFQTRIYSRAERCESHYCDRSCRHDASLSRIPEFFKDRKGYIIFHKRGHPLGTKGGKVRVSRLVYWQESGYDDSVLGLLTNGATVHHRNAVRDDNRPENLELRISDHGAGIGESDMVHTLLGLGYTVQPPLWRKTQ